MLTLYLLAGKAGGVETTGTLSGATISAGALPGAWIISASC